MQDFTLAPRARLAFAVLAVAGLGTAGVIKLARGSDHQDTPDVELNPAADMTDVYAFPGASPGRTVLVLNSWAFITPAQTGNTYFDPSLLYQFKIDNNTDGVEDKVIQITFDGTGPIRRSWSADLSCRRLRGQWAISSRPWRRRWPAGSTRCWEVQTGCRYSRAGATTRSSLIWSSSSASSPIASRLRVRWPSCPTCRRRARSAARGWTTWPASMCCRS